MKKSNFYEKFNYLSQDHLDTYFLDACEKGELDKVKYLLTSPEIKRHADINAEDGEALIRASRKNQFAVMEYLLQSPELKTHLSIHVKEDLVLTGACIDGNLEMVKFLLTSPTLTEHMDLYSTDENDDISKVFFTAYMYKRQELLQYFIFDLNIEKSEGIEKLMKINPGEMYRDMYSDISKSVASMFEKRELNQKLENDLNSDNIIKTEFKKPKV